MLCGSSFGKGVDIARCLKPGCSGIYCSECYLELNNTCSLCMEPMEYGDYSDISEEVWVYRKFCLRPFIKILIYRDSSDDQMSANRGKKSIFTP